MLVQDLPEARKQCILPTLRVDGPADFGFASLAQDVRPHGLIALIGSDIEAIHNCHASGQLTMRFNIYVMLTPLGADSRVERDRHRNRIGQRDAIFTSLLFVSLASAAVALDGKAGNWFLNP